MATAVEYDIEREPPVGELPLVVDLDGTLLKTDFLVESIFTFVKPNPLRVFIILLWLLEGRAELKTRLAQNTSNIDVALLPYNQEVLDWIKKEAQGRSKIVLATATHHQPAQRIAEHLGLFVDVLSSSQNCNLKGTRKRDVLVERYGYGGFDYAGDSAADLPVWAACRNACLINPGTTLERRAHRKAKVAKVIRTTPSYARSVMRALRPHQWLKNLLILVPAAAAHLGPNPNVALAGVAAFLAFSLCASSVYLLNDLLDLADDRRHSTKQFRPIAAGDLSLVSAASLVPIMLGASVAIALLFLPPLFMLALATYYMITLAYSFGIKQIPLIDTITLAALYTTRIIAGAAAFSLGLSFWILAFSMFIFLSLALVKRYTELLELRANNATENAPGRGYRHGDVEILAPIGTAASMASVLVLALYIQNPAIRNLYTNPQIIWLACPLLLYWNCRVWLKAHRGEMHDDPVIFAITDHASQLTGVLFLGVFVAASL